MQTAFDEIAVLLGKTSWNGMTVNQILQKIQEHPDQLDDNWNTKIAKRQLNGDLNEAGFRRELVHLAIDKDILSVDSFKDPTDNENYFYTDNYEYKFSIADVESYANKIKEKLEQEADLKDEICFVNDFLKGRVTNATRSTLQPTTFDILTNNFNTNAEIIPQRLYTLYLFYKQCSWFSDLDQADSKKYRLALNRYKNGTDGSTQLAYHRLYKETGSSGKIFPDLLEMFCETPVKITGPCTLFRYEEFENVKMISEHSVKIDIGVCDTAKDFIIKCIKTGIWLVYNDDLYKIDPTFDPTFDPKIDEVIWASDTSDISLKDLWRFIKAPRGDAGTRTITVCRNETNNQPWCNLDITPDTSLRELKKYITGPWYDGSKESIVDDSISFVIDNRVGKVNQGELRRKHEYIFEQPYILSTSIVRLGGDNFYKLPSLYNYTILPDTDIPCIFNYFRSGNSEKPETGQEYEVMLPPGLQVRNIGNISKHDEFPLYEYQIFNYDKSFVEKLRGLIGVNIRFSVNNAIGYVLKEIEDSKEVVVNTQIPLDNIETIDEYPRIPVNARDKERLNKNGFIISEAPFVKKRGGLKDVYIRFTANDARGLIVGKTVDSKEVVVEAHIPLNKIIETVRAEDKERLNQIGIISGTSLLTSKQVLLGKFAQPILSKRWNQRGTHKKSLKQCRHRKNRKHTIQRLSLRNHLSQNSLFKHRVGSEVLKSLRKNSVLWSRRRRTPRRRKKMCHRPKYEAAHLNE